MTIGTVLPAKSWVLVVEESRSRSESSGWGFDRNNLVTTVRTLNDSLAVRCRMTLLVGALLGLAVLAQSASVNSYRQQQPVLLDEGDHMAKSELPPEIPPDKEHPIARKLIAAEEGENQL